jgi:aryl-alcohol dehydrogenase-like predicted oxidoreductase
MNYNLLGRSSLRISEIGFGCMSLGNDQAQNTMLINKAMDMGINFFDTADIYANGENEITLGKAIGKRRKEVIVATKVGNMIRKDGSGLDWNASKQYILGSVEKSLKRLGTDYIDLYQLHGGTIDDPIDETIEAFGLLQQQGKIRFYGISSIRPNVIRQYVQHSSMVSVMMQYSLLDRRPEETCMELLHQNGIGLLARGGLAKGLLAGKDPAAFLGYTAEQVERAAAAIGKLAGPHRTPAQTALKFVLKSEVVRSAVTGIRTPEQLEDAGRVSDTPELSEQDMSFLREILSPEKYLIHR